MKRNNILVVMLMALALFVAGCGGTEKAPTPQTQTQATAPVEMKTMRIYLAAADAEHVVPAEVKVPQAEATPQRAVEELLKKDAQEKYPLFPKGTKVSKVEVDPKSHVAIADFNSTLKENVAGGSLGEILMVYMIVNTLTEWPDIESVQIRIDGHNVETLNGHMDLSQPIKRKADLIQKK